MGRGVRSEVDPFDFGAPAAAGPAASPEARTVRPEGPDPFDLRMGQRIKLQRNLAGLTQTDLADALRVTFQQVQKYERGVNRVSASRLRQIAARLGIDQSYFYDDREAPPAPARPDRSAEPGFSETQSPFATAPGPDGHADLMSRRETIDLVGAYWRIGNPVHRKRLFDLVRSLAE